METRFWSPKGTLSLNHTHQLVTGLNAMHMAARYGSWQSLGLFNIMLTNLVILHYLHLLGLKAKCIWFIYFEPKKEELLLAGARSDIKTYATVQTMISTRYAIMKSSAVLILIYKLYFTLLWTDFSFIFSSDAFDNLCNVCWRSIFKIWKSRKSDSEISWKTKSKWGSHSWWDKTIFSLRLREGHLKRIEEGSNFQVNYSRSYERYRWNRWPWSYCSSLGFNNGA